MFGNGSHSGTVASLLGLIVLTFVAVGLSAMVDKRLNSSSGKIALKDEVAAMALQIKNLQGVRDRRAAELAQLKSPDGEKAELAQLRSRAALFKGRQVELAHQIEAGKAEFAKTEEEFSAYRNRYRMKVRNAGVGRELGTLTLRSGRKFENAVITRVTDSGIEIRHDAGTAGIGAADLDDSFHDVYQWDRLRTVERLVIEVAQPATADPLAGGERATRQRRASHSRVLHDSEEVRAQREKVRAWSQRVNLLETEWSRARQLADQDRPARGLETWEQRATRLGGEVFKARAQLAAAEAELRVLMVQP